VLLSSVYPASKPASPCHKPCKIRTYSRAPRFDRYQPKSFSRNPLIIFTSSIRPCNSSGIRTYPKWGRGEGSTHRALLRRSSSLLHTVFPRSFPVISCEIRSLRTLSQYTPGWGVSDLLAAATISTHLACAPSRSPDFRQPLPRLRPVPHLWKATQNPPNPNPYNRLRSAASKRKLTKYSRFICMNSIKILSAVPVLRSVILESSSAGAGPCLLQGRQSSPAPLSRKGVLDHA
jgi:hypothetical protein